MLASNTISLCKNCKGGNKPLKALWMFNLLSDCNTVDEIQNTKEKYYPMMLQKDVTYLESVADEEQYAAARCGMSDNVYMYQRSSSQTVEAMNSANKRMRVRGSVDVANSTMLLMKMEAERFERQKTCAANCNSVLTRKGCHLLEGVVHQLKNASLETLRVDVEKMDNEDPPFYDCVVRGIKEMWTVQMAIESDDGLYENTCTCGMVEKDAVPCVHVCAVVKSKLVPNLTLTNVMPHCWSTAAWRKQFPANGSNACNIDMEYLKNKYPPNNKIRYMPDFVAKRKRGRPQKKSRFKSAMEVAMQKKSPRKKRKTAAEYDGLGPDDVEFGFKVEGGEVLVDGQEFEI